MSLTIKKAIYSYNSSTFHKNIKIYILFNNLNNLFIILYVFEFDICLYYTFLLFIFLSSFFSTFSSV